MNTPSQDSSEVMSPEQLLLFVPSLVVDTAVAEGSSASMLRGAQPLGKNELKLEDLFAANNNGERSQNRKL
jgi:hypothetical protein